MDSNQRVRRSGFTVRRDQPLCHLPRWSFVFSTLSDENQQLFSRFFKNGTNYIVNHRSNCDDDNNHEQTRKNFHSFLIIQNGTEVKCLIQTNTEICGIGAIHAPTFFPHSHIGTIVRNGLEDVIDPTLGIVYLDDSFHPVFRKRDGILLRRPRLPTLHRLSLTV